MPTTPQPSLIPMDIPASSGPAVSISAPGYLGRSPDRLGDMPWQRAWRVGALLLLLALATRLIGLGYLDLWGDEIYSYIASTDLLPKLLRWETRENQAHSPLPFLEIKLARALMGNGEMAVRLPAALYGSATVVVVYILVGWRIGWRAAMWAGLLLAINPLALEWSREARMYSDWLFYCGLLVLIAESALNRARRGDLAAAIDWRWWVLGFGFMLVHASNVHAVVTIAAVGLWLIIMVLVHRRVQPRVSLALLLGSGLSLAVFLSSWSLTGIGKLIHYLTAQESIGLVRPAHPLNLSRDIPLVFSMLAGYLPGPATLVVWLAALAGLWAMARHRRWELALLLVLIALGPWLNYVTVVHTFGWFTGRYTFSGLLALSIGLGVIMAMPWSMPRSRLRRVARSSVIVGLLALMILWWPVWREIYTQPKMAVRQAFAPIVQHAQPGDVFIMVPDWYVSLGEYYTWGPQVMPIRPPYQGQYSVTKAGQKPPQDQDFQDTPFRGDFQSLYYQADGSTFRADIPPAAWVFLVFDPSPIAGHVQNLDQRLKELAPLLEAYDANDPSHWKELQSASQGALTLTFRVSAGEIDHITPTRGRAYR